MNNVSLTSAMSSNLLALKQTSALMAMTQNRLATGLKVNSAIDNPSAYYTAVSLNNRAADLNMLLDNMGQSIQTVRAAVEGVDTAMVFLEQMQSIAEQALAEPISSSKVDTQNPSKDVTPASQDSLRDKPEEANLEDIIPLDDSSGGKNLGLGEFSGGSIEDQNAGTDSNAPLNRAPSINEAPGGGVDEAIGSSINDTPKIDDLQLAGSGSSTSGQTPVFSSINDSPGKIDPSAEKKDPIITGEEIFPGTGADEVSDNSEVFSKWTTAFNNVLGQYNMLINDTSYRGVNLLKGEQLNVSFNEDKSSHLNIVGRDISSAALGLSNAEWKSVDDINATISDLKRCVTTLRGLSSELGNTYSIVQTRQDFTENLINILTEGADKLTLADMNEESAIMLALQTRQQLAINSLSLASQSAQSVLRLFA